MGLPEAVGRGLGTFSLQKWLSLGTDFPLPLRRIGGAISGFFPSSTPPQARPLLTSSASSRARTTLLGGGAPLTPEDDPKVARATTSPSAQKPRPDLGKFSRGAVVASQGNSVSVGDLRVASGQGALDCGLSWSGEERVSRSLGAEGFEGQSR